MQILYSENELETKKIGKSLGKKCTGGDIFCLSGDLGAGKTTLSQGIAQGLGVKRNISSPTFIIVNIYKIKKNIKNIKKIIHIDAYRLKTLKELEGIGFFDFIKEKDGVIIIEWGEKIKKYLPKKYIKIKLKNISENKRKIIIS
jgi:tRNA threonylcarbamoyladenosine biosynthesis protein TsaE